MAHSDPPKRDSNRKLMTVGALSALVGSGIALVASEMVGNPQLAVVGAFATLHVVAFFLLRSRPSLPFALTSLVSIGFVVGLLIGLVHARDVVLRSTLGACYSCMIVLVYYFVSCLVGRPNGEGPKG